MRKFLSHHMKSLVTLIACLPWCCDNSHGRSQDSGKSSPTPSQSARANPGNLDDRLLEGIGQGEPEREPASPTKASPERRGEEDGAGQGVEQLDEGSDIIQRNVLVQINRQMLQVETLLSQRNVSAQTQRNQREIVSQLDQLIAALSASRQGPQNGKMESGSNQDQEAPKGTRIGKKAARNSSGEPDQTESVPGEPADPEKVVGDIWGHLPERLRGQMQSVEAVEFLPSYRELIEDYYRRLAEEGAGLPDR